MYTTNKISATLRNTLTQPNCYSQNCAADVDMLIIIYITPTYGNVLRKMPGLHTGLPAASVATEESRDPLAEKDGNVANSQGPRIEKDGNESHIPAISGEIQWLYGLRNGHYNLLPFLDPGQFVNPQIVY